MPVTEYPVVQDLTFQVWDRRIGAWRNLASKATQVTTRRGGQQNGASTAMQTGSLSATLYGALDLANDTALRPNSPIRVVRPGAVARKLWTLIGNGAGTNAAWPRVQQNPGGYGTDTSGEYLSVAWNDAASGTIALNSGALLIGTNVDRAVPTTNVKPSSAFDMLSTYVVNASAIDFDTTGLAAGNARMALVVYTGSPLNPRIIAQGAPRPIGAAGQSTAFPTLRFKAPDADWQLGVIAVDSIFLSGLSTSAPNRYQSVSFSGWTVSSDDSPVPEFTGNISDLSQSPSYDANGVKQTFTTITAVDAIASLANTDRYGAISASGAGYQSWEDRIAQLASSSLVPVNLPGSSDYTLAVGVDALWGGTTRSGFASGTVTNSYPSSKSVVSAYSRTSSSTAATTFTPYVSREFRNLTVGVTYAFSVAFSATGANASSMVDAAAVVMDAKRNIVVQSDPYVMPDNPGDTITVGVTFTATSAIMRLGYTALTAITFASGTGTRSLSLTTTDTVLTRVGDPRGYLLQDLALQSNLANHFDIACQSVGAYWWADRDNTIVFARALPSTSRATFSDTTAGDISYTAVSPTFDTKNVVNSLKMNQHGLEQATGNARDYSQTFTADSSIRRWGVRSDEADTSLYVGAGHEADLQRRASEIMSDLSRPAYQITGLTFNVRSNKAVMDAVDLHRMVTVLYEGRPQRCRVLSITQTITPTRWTAELEFSDISAGTTYGDYTTAYTGTYADFKTKWAGKTFGQFNANPLA